MEKLTEQISNMGKEGKNFEADDLYGLLKILSRLDPKLLSSAMENEPSMQGIDLHTIMDSVLALKDDPDSLGEEQEDYGTAHQQSFHPCGKFKPQGNRQGPQNPHPYPPPHTGRKQKKPRYQSEKRRQKRNLVLRAMARKDKDFSYAADRVSNMGSKVHRVKIVKPKKEDLFKETLDEYRKLYAD